MKIYFLDFEASSLDEGSYPIEIAWVDEHGHGESYLIRPHWSWKGWSKQSEGIHHITQDMLTSAWPADVVARRAHLVLKDALIVTDEPAFDAFWLETLLKVIDTPRLKIESIHSLVGSEIHRVLTKINADPDSREWHRQSRILLDRAQSRAASAYEGAVMTSSQHRALPDAQDFWRRWKAVQRTIDGMAADGT